MGNKFNKIVPVFVLFSSEFSSEDKLIDKFSSYFSFHSSNRKSKENLKTCFHNLNNITLQTSANSQSVIIVLDSSIKNQVATSIAYVHVHNNLVIKIIHYTINITTTEAKLFIIICDINWAIHLSNISWIIVINDSIYTTKRIFDFLLHSYQVHTSVISSKLRKFFVRNCNNSIKF